MSELRKLQDRIHAATEKRITLVEQRRSAEAVLAESLAALKAVGLNPEDAADVLDEGAQELEELLRQIEVKLK